MQPDPLQNLPRPGDRLGRYEVLAELGRGGMAVVMAVADVESGEERAVKLMLSPNSRPEFDDRFRQEFRALSRLDHPGILRVFEWGSWNGRPYFVMERLAGRELREAVEEWRELPPAERYRLAESVLVQVAAAMEYFHARGFVHRDVTPSNIMLLPDGTARLMDFGVVKQPGTELTAVGAVVGTVAYISPEQIDGRDVDARADLYALGGVLYLMLTGRRPFNAATLSGYLEKHRNRPIRPPREVAPTVPPLLDEICVRLMAKDPADRFSSATHLLHVLRRGGESGTTTDGGAWRPRLAGRVREIACIRECIARIDADAPGPGTVLLIEGDEGSGRSRLAHEVAEQARAVGLSATESGATTGHTSYAALAPLYTDLVSEGITPPVPVLAAALDPEAERPPAFSVHSAMRALLGLAGPRVIVLDDIDQADPASVALTDAMVPAVLAGDAPGVLLVVVRAPPGDRDPLPRLTAAAEARSDHLTRIGVGPLSASAVEEMVLNVAEDGLATRVLAARVHRESGGHAGDVRDVIAALVERGDIAPGEGADRGQVVLDEAAARETPLPVPQRIRQRLSEALDQQDETALFLASLLAVAAEDLDAEVLAEAAGIPLDAADEALDGLVDAGLVAQRSSGGTDLFTLEVGRLGDLLLERLTRQRSAELHLALGDALERRHRGRLDSALQSLARHFERAGVAGKACPYLVRAAGALLAAGAVSDALALLERAARVEPAARRSLPLEVADRQLADLVLLRASALFHLGRWTEAAEEAQRADDLGRSLQDRALLARTAIELGRQARRTPDLEAAERHLKKAIALAQEVGDQRLAVVPLYEYGGVLWSRGDLEGAREYWLEARAVAEALQDEQNMALAYNGLGLLAICEGQTADARRHFEEAIRVSVDHELGDRLAVSRINLVELHHLTGNLRKGIELAEEAIEDARSRNHLFGVGLGLRYRAMLLTDIGRLADARESAEEAMRIHRDLGNPDEELASLVLLARVALARGQAAAAEELLDSALELLEGYDTEGFGAVVHAWHARVLATSGRTEAAREALARSERESSKYWPMQQVRALLNQARAHHLLGDDAAANAQAEQALRVADGCGYRYYAMRARQLAARTGRDEAAVARHKRVAHALARSLAANLVRSDAKSFIDLQEINLGEAQPEGSNR